MVESCLALVRIPVMKAGCIAKGGLAQIHSRGGDRSWVTPRSHTFQLQRVDAKPEEKNAKISRIACLLHYRFVCTDRRTCRYPTDPILMSSSMDCIRPSVF
jgi:hypothetical protein